MAQQEIPSKNDIFIRHFECQRCKNPLKLTCFKGFDDESFDELCHSVYLNANKDARDILLPKFHKKLENSAMRKVVLPIKMCDFASDFMVIGELTSLPLDNTQSFKIIDTLKNLISDNPTPDRPFCEECTDNILDQMDTHLKTSEDEIKMYQEFLLNFKDNDEENLQYMEFELQNLKAKEAELKAKLLEFEGEEKRVKELLESHEKKFESVEKEEINQYREYCTLKHKMILLDDDECSVNNQLMYAEAQLNKLANTNVFSATFHIWHSGHFGTINNFRLGRLPKETVEWSEINAAWGQTVLLLHCLANKINLTFDRYRLVPYGNHSYIVPLDNKTKDLPLYCLGGIKYVLDHRFDLAMVAFLDCLQQFKEKVEDGNDSFRLPYRMDKGKIEDKSARKSYSVKIQLNSQEQWTKALKFMLTNLKWALAWVSTQFQDSIC